MTARSQSVPRPLYYTLTPARCIALFAAGLASACGDEPAGLRPTPQGDGPRVVFDLTASPLPEIPMPNDVATRPDCASPTGKRLNVSLNAVTRAESRLRAKIDSLDGFGVFSPMTVRFDDKEARAAGRPAIDLENVRDRLAGPPGGQPDHDFSNDPVLLVDVDPSSPEYGRAIPLDVGQGNFPLALEWPWQYWDQDEHRDSSNLLFETHEEDVNHNGVLDPYEDYDFDGILDHPNTWSGLDKGPLAADDLITFYEKETDTMILWPMVPLRQMTRYAVVLTKYLTSTSGKPVRSPFPYVNHADQTPDLLPLKDILPRYGFSLDDVVFAWSFTTQSITSELEQVRAGLYGHGPLAALEQEYPPDMEPKVVRDRDPDTGAVPERPYILPADKAMPLFAALGPLLNYRPEVVSELQRDTAHVDYFVLGTFTTPNFLADRDGRATPMYPDDDNESFDVAMKGANATRGPSRASFICAIPKATEEFKPPFRVMLYGHGYSGAPFEIFGFAGRMAKFGIAMCGLDAPGHGLALPADDAVDWSALVPPILEGMGLRQFYEAFKFGRIRDLDNDGMITSFDNGGDFWSYDVFHTRDMVRQAVVDHMQFIRILRQLGERRWSADTSGDGQADLMGDFNGDGVVDIGTVSNQRFAVFGQSMGAIVAEVLAGVEPTISAATPVSGGGGLISIGLRTNNPGVPEAVMMPLMGPFVVFSPQDDGAVEVAWLTNHLHREYPRAELGQEVPKERPHYYPFARSTAIRPGDAVIVRNKTNGKEVRAFRPLDPRRGFRVSLPCDALSAMEKRPVLGLSDGATQPVPVSCEPSEWTVDKDSDKKPVGIAHCPTEHPERALLFGDAVEIEVHDGLLGPVKAVIDRFEVPVTFEGAYFPKGAPLVAIATGLGRPRNTPEFRRLMGIAAWVVERGDPIAYARHYGPKERLDFSYDPAALPGTPMIVYHSVGDSNVPISASLALARAMGVLRYLPDQKGPVQNDLLLAAGVAEGVEKIGRHSSKVFTLADWAADDGSHFLKDPRWPTEFEEEAKTDPKRPLPVHADPDNADSGIDEFGEPAVPGYERPTVCDEGFGCMALRLPYTYPLGAHGVEPSNPTRRFNINNFVVNQIGVFAASDGKVISDDPCLAGSTCAFLPAGVRR